MSIGIDLMSSKKFSPFYFYFPNMLAYFFGLFLISLALWTQKYFGLVTIDQVISTFNFGIEGAIKSDSIFIKKFIDWCLVWPTIVSIVFIVLNRLQAHRLHQQTPYEFRSPFITITNFLIRLNHPLLYLSFGVMLLSIQFKMVDYAKTYYSSNIDYFSSYYLRPNQVDIQPGKLKSLVIIYVESLEKTYAAKEIFGHNLLQPLNQFKNISFSFANYKQMPGTGWTIAGIVSTQCSVPLKQLTIFGNNRLGENINNFLPNAKCLSDILADHGYTNIFMNGASTSVGGKIQFLKSHHYSEIYGREEWLKLGFQPSSMNSWGLDDYVLFQQAKLKLAELVKKNQLFNLNILTVDTHGVNGQLSQYCKDKGYHQFDGIVECTAEQVADFIHYVQVNSWLDKINIVVLGDHLAMQNAVGDKLNAAPARSIFNLFISQHKYRPYLAEITAFDMLPTLLNFIGFKFKGDKLGLGYSGISHANVKSKKYNNEIEKHIYNHSKAYARLWLGHNKKSP